MLLVHFFSGMSYFCFLWCCYWVTIRQRLNYNFRVGMFDDLFGNNAVTVRIKHSTLHWTCAFRPCTFSPVPVYVSSTLHWTCAFRPCTFSPAPVYVSTRPWTFWPVDVLTRIRSDSVPLNLHSQYQYHGWWCPGDVRSQVISNYDLCWTESIRSPHVKG